MTKEFVHKNRTIYLKKGELIFLVIPEGTQHSVEDVQARQNGSRMILVRVA